ncbi:hypothetical protein LUZ60_009527 [Juncus effusus]|nr:hypothetical protein LUZ60_009527 [Juncus effusus]
MDVTSSHVVLFSFPAHGHISPFLVLANRLHEYRPNLTITLVCTPRNIDIIRSSLSPSSRLNLHSLPFAPSDYDLPDSESTIDLVPHQFPVFFLATESLRPAFEEFVCDRSKRAHLCIISDIFFGWTVDVAREYKAFHTFFTGQSAFGAASIFSLWMNLPHMHTKSEEFSLPEYPDVVVNRSQLPPYILFSNGKDQLSLFMQRQFANFHKSNALLVNTFEDIDRTGLGMLERTFKTLVLPFGPLVALPDISTPPSGSDLEILNWMDSKPVASVLYISFGSQDSIHAKQMMELALGLETSGRPFIWAIRPPIGFSAKDGFKDEWLPEEFEERMRKENRGLFVHGWAPQIRILGHQSVGAFLSHCGWNSVLESLYYGVPIIGWPLGADQPYSARLLIDLGVCVKLAQNNMEWSKVEKEKVEEVVEMVMGENEKGKEVRKKTNEIKDVMRATWKEEGCSVKVMTEFLKISEDGGK